MTNTMRGGMAPDRLETLPGLRMAPGMDPEGITMLRPPLDRSCGTCRACCTLMPVGEIGKPADSPCIFLSAQRGCEGCTVYASRPRSCFAWSCLWAVDASIPDALRPDRSHVIFDIFMDTITMVKEAGIPLESKVFVIWVDPKYPKAYRAPLVREVMTEVAAKLGIPTLVRIPPQTGIVVAPPSLTKAGWQEKKSILKDGVV
jgi:hypothetical protein